MTLFDYVDKHPWWTLLYLMIVSNAIAGWFRVNLHRNSKETK